MLWSQAIAFYSTLIGAETSRGLNSQVISITQQRTTYNRYLNIVTVNSPEEDIILRRWTVIMLAFFQIYTKYKMAYTGATVVTGPESSHISHVKWLLKSVNTYQGQQQEQGRE